MKLKELLLKELNPLNNPIYDINSLGIPFQLPD